MNDSDGICNSLKVFTGRGKSCIIQLHYYRGDQQMTSFYNFIWPQYTLLDMITEEVICKLSQSDVSNTNTESN
jgi:hypothetical protein